MSRKLSCIVSDLKTSRYYGFIKSFAILVLASVLLVTSVFAWFSTDTSVNANGLSITVSSNDSITVSRGNASLSETISLPAATKPADTGVTSAMLSSALLYKWYKVEARDSSSVELQFNLSNGGLMCYAFAVDSSDEMQALTDLKCAEMVKSNLDDLVYYDDDLTDVVNSPQTFALNDGMCYVIIVYIGDYDKLGNTLVSSGSSVEMTVDLSFVPAQ